MQHPSAAKRRLASVPTDMSGTIGRLLPERKPMMRSLFLSILYPGGYIGDGRLWHMRNLDSGDAVLIPNVPRGRIQSFHSLRNQIVKVDRATLPVVEVYQNVDPPRAHTDQPCCFLSAGMFFSPVRCRPGIPSTWHSCLLSMSKNCVKPSSSPPNMV